MTFDETELGVGDAGEGAAVEWRDALLVDRGTVLGSRVADVFLEAPAGVALGGLAHVTVAGDLGEDRGSSDGGTETALSPAGSSGAVC